MSLVKWNDNRLPIFNAWVDNFFSKGDSFLNSGQGLTAPAANVAETDTAYELELAAPGMNKEDFNVEIENGAISISSKSQTSKESENKNFTRQEYSYESFYRSFSLPEDVDDSNIEASYTDGVLKIVIPKTEDSKPKSKSIEIS